jgi:release factor glutamine methyltransferase
MIRYSLFILIFLHNIIILMLNCQLYFIDICDIVTPVMTIHSWLNNAIQNLKDYSVESARLDAKVLLADVLDQDRSWVLAHPEVALSDSQLAVLDKQIKRRMKHEPIAYILGRQEFFGRDFAVTPDTLTPRPETETLVECALDVLRRENVNLVADIGTGSGCIAITLSLELHDKPTAFVGYDVSIPAITVAKKNAKLLASPATFHQANLHTDANLWRKADMIVANLPYVPTDFHINLAASHEPEFAIFGGKDGLDYYRTLFGSLPSSCKYVITESLPPQHTDLTAIAKQHSYTLDKTQDFIQVFKR